MHPEFCWTQAEAVDFLSALGKDEVILPEPDFKAPKPLWSRLSICCIAVSYLEKLTQGHVLLTHRSQLQLVQRAKEVLSRVRTVKQALAEI